MIWLYVNTKHLVFVSRLCSRRFNLIQTHFRHLKVGAICSLRYRKNYTFANLSVNIKLLPVLKQYFSAGGECYQEKEGNTRKEADITKPVVKIAPLSLLLYSQCRFLYPGVIHRALSALETIANLHLTTHIHQGFPSLAF